MTTEESAAIFRLLDMIDRALAEKFMRLCNELAVTEHRLARLERLYGIAPDSAAPSTEAIH
jgi:hypothetical protein